MNRPSPFKPRRSGDAAPPGTPPRRSPGPAPLGVPSTDLSTFDRPIDQMVPMIEVTGTEVVETPESLAWWVRVEGIPAEVPASSRVSFRDDRLDELKGDSTFVDLLITRSSLGTDGIRVFSGEALPPFTFAITPVAPRPGAESRRIHVDADAFSAAADNRRTAVIRWSDMPIVADSIAVETHELPDQHQPQSDGPPVLLIAAGVAGLAALYYWWSTKPRGNPGACCASCARGGPCRGSR